MYSQKLVGERLELAQRELGFQLEYHDPSDIDTFEENLRRKYPDAYDAAESAAQDSDDPTRAFQLSITRSLNNPAAPRLSTEETRFMANETALIACDAAYFLTRFYWIKPAQDIQRFSFRTGQLAQFNIIAELEEKGSAIEMIACKARQLGISTETEGLILHRGVTGYALNAVVASADRSSTVKMSQMCFLGYDMLNWWVRPLSTRRVESDKGILEFRGARSGISFQHGNQKYGIARGDTVAAYHLSECASYDDPAALIEASLFKCVHPRRGVFGMLESSAEGDMGWWYNTYWGSKKAYRLGTSRLRPMFLAWWVATDMYPMEDWLRVHPIPSNWRMDQATRQMVSRASIFLQESPEISAIMGTRFEKQKLPEHLAQYGRLENGFPRGQAWYWECNFLEHRDKGIAKLWNQEMPTDDKDAFVGSYDNVFGREIVAEVFSQRATAYDVYAIVGQSIEDRFDPDHSEIDTDYPIIPVSYTNRKTEETYQWELVPMQWEEPFRELTEIRDDQSHQGKLFIWLKPEPGYDYAVGVDTGGGIELDDTVIVVSRRGRDGSEQDVQAAEFRWNKVSHQDAFAWAMAICAYYSRYMRDNEGIVREPYVAIEQIAAVGDTCQLQMSFMGYSRFHKMTRYDTDEGKIKRSKVTGRRGWFTNGWSRPILTGAFVSLVKNGWYKINSAYTLREMTQWEVHYTSTGKEKYEHKSQANDDGIFANAMAAFCPNDLTAVADRSKNQWRQVQQEKNPAIDIGVVRSGAVFNADFYADQSFDLEARIKNRRTA